MHYRLTERVSQANNKDPPAEPGVFNVSRSKRLRGRYAAPRLATEVAGYFSKSN